MNTGILSMNSFFFIFWNSVNKCPYDYVNLEKKNEENLNEVVKCLYFRLVNYALSGSIGREGLRGVLVSRYISQLQESICKNYQRKNSRFSTIRIWYFVIKCGGRYLVIIGVNFYLCNNSMSTEKNSMNTVVLLCYIHTAHYKILPTVLPKKKNTQKQPSS